MEWPGFFKITLTWIQISHQNWNDFLSNIIGQFSLVSRSKTMWLLQAFYYKYKNTKKLAFNALQTYQILTNNDHMHLFCISYLSTTVNWWYNFSPINSHQILILLDQNLRICETMWRRGQEASVMFASKSVFFVNRVTAIIVSQGMVRFS